MGETRESLFQELAALRKHIAGLEKTQVESEQLSKEYETSLESITDCLVSFDEEWRYLRAVKLDDSL